MKRTEQMRDEVSLRPIGAALAAVVAGLGASSGGDAKATEIRVPEPPQPSSHQQMHFVDPTNDPRLDEDASLILGPSEPVEPFGDAPAAKQRDLFEL
jgi:hypothetical protein